MTATSFLNELRKIQSSYTWFVTKDGRIRATFGATRTSRIFDPITAVAFSQTGQFFPDAAWAKASNVIGLSFEDCADFVSAFNYKWDEASRQGTLRHDVLDAVRIPTHAAPTTRLSAVEC